MTKPKAHFTEEQVKACWPDEGYGTTPDEIKITVTGDTITVRVSQMYNAVPLGLKNLMRLSRVFNTDRFDVDHFSHGGCETCDYGSAYGHEFEIKKSDIGVYDIPKEVVEKA